MNMNKPNCFGHIDVCHINSVDCIWKKECMSCFNKKIPKKKRTYTLKFKNEKGIKMKKTIEQKALGLSLIITMILCMDVAGAEDCGGFMFGILIGLVLIVSKKSILF